MHNQPNIRRLFRIVLSLLILLLTVPTVLAYVVVETPSKKNEFVPAVDTDLTITKTVEHPLGDEYVIPSNITFSFLVDLGDEYKSFPVITTQGTKTTDENGRFTVELCPNSLIALEGLVGGTEVTVTELPTTHRGFTAKGSVSQTATIDKDGIIGLEFVNVYAPTPATLTDFTLTGIKTLTGRAWQSGDIFSFKLEQVTDAGATELAVKTVTYDANDPMFNTFDFSETVRTLSLAGVGTHTFRISELAGSVAGMAYDTATAEFTVTVTDTDMDGQLEIASVTVSGAMTLDTEKSGYHLTATFRNTFTTTTTQPTTPTTKPSGEQTTTTFPTTPTTKPSEPDIDDPLPPSTGQTSNATVYTCAFLCFFCVMAMPELAKRRQLS